MHEDDELEGGDAACWAHMFEQEEQEASPTGPDTLNVAHLTEIAGAARRSGPAWTGASDDLNVNLLVFTPGDGVAEHVNAEVDVLIIGISGSGMLTIDGTDRPIRAGDAVLIPKGARRGTRAGAEQFAYLTCHRRRAGLWPALGTRTQS